MGPFFVRFCVALYWVFSLLYGRPEGCSHPLLLCFLLLTRESSLSPPAARVLLEFCLSSIALAAAAAMTHHTPLFDLWRLLWVAFSTLLSPSLSLFLFLANLMLQMQLLRSAEFEINWKSTRITQGKQLPLPKLLLPSAGCNYVRLVFYHTLFLFLFPHLSRPPCRLFSGEDKATFLLPPARSPRVLALPSSSSWEMHCVEQTRSLLTLGQIELPLQAESLAKAGTLALSPSECVYLCREGMYQWWNRQREYSSHLHCCFFAMHWTAFYFLPPLARPKLASCRGLLEVICKGLPLIGAPISELYPLLGSKRPGGKHLANFSDCEIWVMSKVQMKWNLGKCFPYFAASPVSSFLSPFCLLNEFVRVQKYSSKCHRE